VVWIPQPSTGARQDRHHQGDRAGRTVRHGRPTRLVHGRSTGLPQTFFVEPGRENGEVPCIGDGANHWALVHVDDIAELYALALNAPAGSVYAGAGGQNPTLAEIAGALSHAAGCPGKIVHLTAAEAEERMGPIAEAYALDQQFSGARARQ
jgi:nucleoside-diphosphate-sugar epimerase